MFYNIFQDCFTFLDQVRGYKTFLMPSMKFILLFNVKMPTIVSILTFISMLNTKSETLKAELFVSNLVFMSR